MDAFLAPCGASQEQPFAPSNTSKNDITSKLHRLE